MSGSVAAIKVPLIADALASFAEVEIIATDAARKLIPAEFLAATAIPIRGTLSSVEVTSATYRQGVLDVHILDNPQVTKRSGGTGSKLAIPSCTLS